MPARPKAAGGGRAMVNIFDGQRQPYSDAAPILITARDGNEKIQSREEHDDSSVQFDLPTFDNFGDNYTFLAAADGYKDAGFSVKLAPGVNQIVELMLIPNHNELSFANATWGALDGSRPDLKKLLALGAASADQAANRYGDIQENGGEVLACLLNITTAMQQIHLPQGTPLDYVEQVIWDESMAQDRFFAWADPKLIDQIEQAKQQKPPEFVNAPAGLHKGATRSYKQIEFGEANLQLTFHENDRKTIGGVNCVMVEPDIDYFKDTTAHLFLEVAVNSLGSMTDPRAVYVLRWIAGRRAGIPEFDPLYTIQRA